MSAPKPVLARTIPPNTLYADDITLARRMPTPPLPRLRGRITPHTTPPTVVQTQPAPDEAGVWARVWRFVMGR